MILTHGVLGADVVPGLRAQVAARIVDPDGG